jgi:hypothetical protein
MQDRGEKMLVFLLALCTVSSLQGAEYLYPVGWIRKSDCIKLYLNYQKTIGDTTELLLWEWDPVTKVAGSVVIPAYTPAAVKVLPHTTEQSGGIGFVDKGRVMVKSFSKRSPKSISFYEPIADMAFVEWIDQDSFYFMGKEGNNFGIFYATVKGALRSLLYRKGTDYLYPQKVGNSLFCITRHGDTFGILQSSFPNCMEENQNNVSAGNLLLQKYHSATNYPLIKAEDTQEIINLGQQSAAFLTMVSETQGYYITHPTVIDRMQTSIVCDYYQITKTESEWLTRKILSLRVPTNMLIGSAGERLYESFLPLVPRISETAIYYASCDDHLKMNVYRYDLTTEAITQLSIHQRGEIFFAPLQVNAMIFYGGSLLSEDLGTGNSLPAVWINQDGFLCADLPHVVDVPLALKDVLTGHAV